MTKTIQKAFKFNLNQYKSALKNLQITKTPTQNLHQQNPQIPTLIPTLIKNSLKMNPKSKPNKDFLSLINAALLYFDQTSPISSDLYDIKKSDLQHDLNSQSQKNQKLQETLSSLIKSIHHLKQQRQSLDKYFSTLKSQHLTQDQAIKCKESLVESSHQELKSLSKIKPSSRSLKTSFKSHTKSIQLYKHSEESEDLTKTDLFEYDLIERFHTDH